jgi:osmotically-inducible protein OsmY
MTRWVCLLLLAAFPFTLIEAQKKVSDDELVNNVRRRLANDVQVKGGTLDVDVAQGVVTIRGTLESEKLKLRAEKVAGKVSGVKKVINEIKVVPVRNR